MENMPKRIRKGSTLTEICVVLAVVSIVSTVVLSFCMMANRRSVASANRLRIMEERKMIETIVETWCESMAAAGKDISIIDVRDSITLTEGILKAKMPEEPSIQFKCDAAKSLIFNVYSNISNNLGDLSIPDDPEKAKANILIVCTVEFNDPYADPINPPKYVFAVNSRIGESSFVKNEQTDQSKESEPSEPVVTPGGEEQGEAGGAE